jgi:hypothetical protein
MTTHPIDAVAGLTDTNAVSKAGIVSYEKTYVPLRLADANALRALDLSSSFLVFISGKAWQRDPTNTTSTDDGVSVIVDAAGSRWIIQSAASGDVIGPASAVSGNIATFNGVTGKLLQDSGKAHSIDGTLASNSDAKIPTEKAVKTYADTKIPSTFLDTDGTLAANSDSKVATQKAVKTYADALIAANDAMVFKGATDCSANPNYPAADRGHTYRVSVAGKIGGASGVVVEAGDIFICNTDATASGNQATVGTSWNVIQTNLDGAVIGPASATADSLARWNGTTGKLLKDGAVIGTDVQAFHARLADIAGITFAQGDIIYHNGTNLVKLGAGTSGQFLKTLGAAANPAWGTIPGGGDMLTTNNLSDLVSKPTARTNLGVGTGDSPLFAGVDIGNADTSLTRVSAGKIAVEGVTILTAGKQTIFIPAGAMKSRTTNGAASGSVELTTNKNMFGTLDFDTTTQEFAQFIIRMPKSWDEGTVTFRAIWSHPATATNFGVAWALAGVALSDNEAGDTAFGTAVIAGASGTGDTGGTTNNIYITPESAAITIGSSPVAEDLVMFQVNRTVADGADTLAVDARLHGITLYYTSNDATDA